MRPSMAPTFPASRPSKITLAAASVALCLVLRYFHRRKGTYAALFGDPAKLAQRVKSREEDYDFDEYDVVIVGGGARIVIDAFGSCLTSLTGTAGCVLASRISEDPNIRVLLLEAGSRYVFEPCSVANVPGRNGNFHHNKRPPLQLSER